MFSQHALSPYNITHRILLQTCKIVLLEYNAAKRLTRGLYFVYTFAVQDILIFLHCALIAVCALPRGDFIVILFAQFVLQYRSVYTMTIIIHR